MAMKKKHRERKQDGGDDDEGGMRSEGRLTGYTRDNSSSTTELKRARVTRVSNKPTNASKDSGKCKRPRCRGCHTWPPTKAKGERNKAKGLDVVADAEWALHNNDNLRLYDKDYDDDDEEVGISDRRQSQPNLEELQDDLQIHMRRAWQRWQDQIKASRD